MTQAESDNPGYQILLASLLIDDGQLEAALSVYEQVCERFPDQTKYLDESIIQLRRVLCILSIEHRIDEIQTSGPKSASGSPAAGAAQPGDLQIRVVDRQSMPSSAAMGSASFP